MSANRMRSHRQARGLTQAALAEAAGISRQSLSSIEAGRSEPSVSIALRIAAALGERVEALFGTTEASAESIEAELAGETHGARRVALARIGERWVAHPLSGRRIDTLAHAASGVIGPRAHKPQAKARVELLQPLASARETIVIAGCAPALGVLADKLSSERGPGRFLWLERSSAAALQALKLGHTHLAGVHHEERSGSQPNVAAVRRALPKAELALITLARWQAGLLVARGNPLRIAGVADLGRSRLRIAAREPGAGARSLLEAQLQAAGLSPRTVLARAQVFHGHHDVAHAIAIGAADAGVAIEGSAIAYGLPFIPLASERFDLVAPRQALSDPRIARLCDMLGSGSFQKELAALGGYDGSQCGVSSNA